MKELIRRWLGTAQPLKRDFEDLAASAIEALARAKDAHISDLRLLIDKGHEREEKLAGMVERFVQHQFYRPTITGGAIPENRGMPAVPAESLSDVAVYDEEADAQQVKEHDTQLQKLIDEQNQYGEHKVEA